MAALSALSAVSDRIEAGGPGLPAPSPYPQIAGLGHGLRRLRQGSYWFAFTPVPNAIIAGIFYGTADIPNRLK
jgi:hypothetical protein